MQQKKSGISGRFGRAVTVIAFSFILGACSMVPDWANPVEWYKGTAEWISGDDDETVAARRAARSPALAPPGADRPFPPLSSVPARPQGMANRDQRRQQVQSGLVADRDRARHVALNPVQSPQSAKRNISGAPPRPVLTAPKAPLVAAVPPGNQAFQKAIAQQAAPPRRSLAPIRRNTMATPPVPRGTVTLIPPRTSAPFRSVLRRGISARPVAGPIGPSARSVAIGTVLFANGSAKISGKYAKTLRAIVKMQKQRGGTLRVIGHASSRTRDTKPLAHQIANFRISMARAKAVAGRLVRYGARPSGVAISGVADNQPIYHEFMPLGEAGNRRAEIYLDY